MSKHTPTPWKWAEGTGDITHAWNGAEHAVADVGMALPWHEDIICAAREAGANAALIVRAVNSHQNLLDSVIEFLEPYHDRDSADLFAKLPGTEAQRVVRARAVLKGLGVEV